MSSNKIIAVLFSVSLLFGTLGARFLSFENPHSGAITGVVFVFLLSFIHPAFWKTLINTITSRTFTIWILSALMLFLVMGTLILQNGKLDQYNNIYGIFLSRIILYTGVYDIFQAPPFTVVLSLLWISLVALLFKRRFSLKWRSLGFSLIHAGAVVVLFGGSLSRLYGEKGVMPLNQNQAENMMETVRPSRICHLGCKGEDYRQHEAESRKGLLKKLPFSIKLASFSVEHYPQENRLYLYEYNQGKNMFSAKRVWTQKDLREGVLISGHRFTLNGPISASDKQDLAVSEEPNGTSRVVTFDVASPEPFYLDKSRKNVLVYEKSQNAISAYSAKMAILENEKIVKEADVKVNSPLSHGGYIIYQSAYDPTKPNYTILQVVYDPGLWLVYAGFLMLFLGVIFSALCTPMIRKGFAP